MNLSLLVPDPRVNYFAIVYSTATLNTSNEMERFFFRRSRGAFLNIAPLESFLRAVKKGRKREGSMKIGETEFYLNDREGFRTLAQMARIVQTELNRSPRGSWIFSKRETENLYFKTASTYMMYIYVYISFCNKRMEYGSIVKIEIVHTNRAINRLTEGNRYISPLSPRHNESRTPSTKS